MANKSLLAVIDVLRKYDKPAGLSRKEIEEYLLNDHDETFKREKFTAIINEINEMDEYKVQCTKGRYSRYRLTLRDGFTPTERELLCALIADTDALSRKEAKAMINKLIRLTAAGDEHINNIDELVNDALDNKNEISKIDKLELISQTICDGSKLRYKLYRDGKVSEYHVDTPVCWFVKDGRVRVEFKLESASLAELINIEAT